jgi:hypothetical protein
MVGRVTPRVGRALLVLIIVGLALSALADLPGAHAAVPSYQIVGDVYQPNGLGPVPANVTVQLIAAGTHTVYTTKTAAGGTFAFNQSNTNSELAPGWWGLWVPPQTFFGVCSAPQCSALPGASAPHDAYYSSSTLSCTTCYQTVANVAIVGFDSTAAGNVYHNGAPVSNARVEILSPNYPDFAMQTTTTNSTGYFSVPDSTTTTLVLFVQDLGSPTLSNYSLVTGLRKALTVNVENYLVYGTVSSAATGNPIHAGLNQTLIDTTAGPNVNNIFAQYNPVGGSFAIGTYPGGFTSGTETFDAIVSPIGYQPAIFPVSTSSPAPSGLPSARSISLAPMAPPAVYRTTLNFTSGASGTSFGLLKVSTTATLGNYSVFPELPNASVSQLWAQLGLDFDHGLVLSNSTLTGAVATWIADQGPFFAAGQNDATLNGTGFGQPSNATESPTLCATPSSTSFTCVGAPSSLSLSTGNGLLYGWTQAYNVTSKLPLGGTSPQYILALKFRHPTSIQSFNYTVILPKGYVLAANNPVPLNSKIIASGPNGTWNRFTLVSLPSSSPTGFANFTVVKGGGVTPRADVSVPSFSFSTANVINSSRTNYQVAVGAGENVSFSALNSTYPVGTNGSYFRWTFGDGGTNATTSPVTHHIYASAGTYKGSLNVTSSAGVTAAVGFTVYAGTSPPTPKMNVNLTPLSAGGVPYYIVNWSQPVEFNATGSTSTLFSGAPVPGVIGAGVYTITSYGFSATYNYSVSAGFTYPFFLNYSFRGAGTYYHPSVTIGGVPVNLSGWEYNVTLTVWDGQGHSASVTRTFLVRDTEPPVAGIAALLPNGKPVPSSGVTEGAHGTVAITFNATNSTDPHNGTIVSYAWHITDSANSSVNDSSTRESFTVTLTGQSKPYRVGLTVTDLAGNKGNTTMYLTVGFNATIRPILTVGNLTGPTKMNAGTHYTFSFNITNTGGNLSTAYGVLAHFYLTGPSGSGPQYVISSRITYYNWTSGVLASTPISGTIDLALHHTIRATMTWTPVRTGNYWLVANATCGNQYLLTPSSTHLVVTLNQNPLILGLEYGGIAAGAVIVIVFLVFLYRRRLRGPSAGPSRPGARLERGGRRLEEDEEDEE